MSIANYFTFSRILIAPLFLLLYLEHDLIGIDNELLPYVLIALLTISELSDALDGYLARKYNQVTDLGKVLDPMADSIARISVFLTFTLEPVKLPMILVFIFLYRDSVVSTLRTICALKGFALAARTSGKIKAVVQAVAAFIVLILMIPHSLGLISTESLHNSGTLIVGIASIYTLYSGVDYINSNWHYIAKFLYPQSSQIET
ncbi:MAG TPA: CDP-diacylglycerol--glycerol-3-phosphate 3-phosphatidyltransferase [Parachlamydiaceae bacterium]|nr:CDP-diacylglycerol--glycerol-3-phosphate 3-phosphatidyltransferase [Parachlamydiaceae bacterium]